jgi:hypothetical protein
MMRAEPATSERPLPSHEPRIAESIGPQADYVASPLAMAALFDWDDEDDR